MDRKVKKAQRQRFTRMSPKRQITIPIGAATEAGLRIGERLEVRVDGPGRLLVVGAGDPVAEVAGLLDGCYGAGYLEALRDEWR